MGFGAIAEALLHLVGPELTSRAVDAIVARSSKKDVAKSDDEREEFSAAEAGSAEGALLSALARQIESMRTAEAAQAGRIAALETDLSATREAMGRIEARLRMALYLGVTTTGVALGALAVAVAG